MLDRNYSELTPAYGRDYKSAKAAKADFDANKDFVLNPEGCYINKEQIKLGITVIFRYNGLRSVASVKVK
jgi:hypothetical protein